MEKAIKNAKGRRYALALTADVISRRAAARLFEATVTTCGAAFCRETEALPGVAACHFAGLKTKRFSTLNQRDKRAGI